MYVGIMGGAAPVSGEPPAIFSTRYCAPATRWWSPKGPKPKIDAAEVRRLRDDEKLGPAAIALRLGIGRASVYRLLGKETGRMNGTPDADQA